MDLKKPKIAHFYDVKYSKNYGVFLKIFDVRIFVRILAKICGHLCTFWPKYMRFLKKFWCAHFCAPFGQLMCAFEFRIIEHSVHGTKIRGVYVWCTYYFYVLCVNSEELGTWILGFGGATAINLAMDLSKLNNKFWLRFIIFHNMYNATLNTKYLKK